jgi:hypothetical protein
MLEDIKNAIKDVYITYKDIFVQKIEEILSDYIIKDKDKLLENSLLRLYAEAKFRYTQSNEDLQIYEKAIEFIKYQKACIKAICKASDIISQKYKLDKVIGAEIKSVCRDKNKAWKYSQHRSCLAVDFLVLTDNKEYHYYYYDFVKRFRRYYEKNSRKYYYSAMSYNLTLFLNQITSISDYGQKFNLYPFVYVHTTDPEGERGWHYHLGFSDVKIDKNNISQLLTIVNVSHYDLVKNILNEVKTYEEMVKDIKNFTKKKQQLIILFYLCYSHCYASF